MRDETRRMKRRQEGEKRAEDYPGARSSSGRSIAQATEERNPSDAVVRATTRSSAKSNPGKEIFGKGLARSLASSASTRIRRISQDEDNDG